MLERGGAHVQLAGFARDDVLAPAVARRRPMLLGRSADAAMVNRALATLRQVLLPSDLKRWFADCDVIMARNLEQLAIARAMVGQRPLVYECLDIHRLLVGTGLAARAVQSVEGRLLPRADLLITSSPAFLSRHFDHRPLRAPSLLVENKLLVEEGKAPPRRPAVPAVPLTIGWFGMLRCRTTFAFLKQLAIEGEGRIQVLVSGKPSPAEFPDFEKSVGEVPNMRFTGPYTYADLPELYGQCHFAWTIDWFEEGLNSAMLLPNRLYEALAFGAIPIALADIEVGRWLTRHDAGFLVSQPEEARRELLAMTPERIASLQERALAVAPEDVLADDRDCRALVAAIGMAGGRA
ncbi:hypothetical protein WYH_01762 [Croceibacterium atlanticum]|uniref:Glycosyl transferase family 1 n=2 Tax=Croceibacterium atlanticum TaxID=1267766 RepID=A0A0F7KQJ1_9SPHN|nr:hypothetical protein WYH_01762 [Croceibacterium atlanticum]